MQDAVSPDPGGRVAPLSTRLRLWGAHDCVCESLRADGCPCPGEERHLGLAGGDLLDEPQSVLSDVDQAPQSLHWFLGRWRSVRKLSETKRGKAVSSQGSTTVLLGQGSTGGRPSPNHVRTLRSDMSRELTQGHGQW